MQKPTSDHILALIGIGVKVTVTVATNLDATMLLVIPSASGSNYAYNTSECLS